MSWITISEPDVITKLSGPEIAAMKSAALQALQGNPLPEIITQVVLEIRGYVAACERNTLGAGETIPNELLGTAISRIRFELATRLPVASLLTEDRRTANANALQRLRDVAKCDFLVVQPEDPATDQAGGPGIEVVSKTTRTFTRDDLRGL
jgi:hypothetical protein